VTYPASTGRVLPVLYCPSSETNQSTTELIASGGKRVREGEEVHHWKIENCSIRDEM
jgi:hypothetical protein